MIPTSEQSAIEGRYKEYAYNPMSTTSAPAANFRTTLSSRDAASTEVGGPRVLSKEEYGEAAECEESEEQEEDCGFSRRCSHTVARHTFQLQDMTEKGSQLLQYLAASAANLIIVSCGTVLAWTSPIFPKLLEDPVAYDNPIGRPTTEEENSWIAGFVSLGAIIGSFIGGYLGEKCGRKKTMLFSAVPHIIAWIMVATATNVPQLYVARFIFGCALAMDFTVVPMYCGEIAETSVRGALGSFLQLFITVGLLFTYCIGPYVSYTILWVVSLCIPILFVAIFITMPESPYYLLTTGRRNEAVQALARLRGKSKAAVQKEADEMQAVVDEAFSTRAKVSDLFTVKSNFKALLMTCAMASFQQLTGINVVLMFTQDIFQETGSTIKPAICTIIVGVVQCLASGVTPIVVERLGRRALLIPSGIGTAITTGALGLYFYLQDVSHADVGVIWWLPVISLAIFICIYSIGWGPLTWAVMGEMFAPAVKSKASGITVCVCWFLSFIITKYFSKVKEAFGSHTAFWIFTVCCILSVLFTIFILPETKGKSLQQIQDELNGFKPSINNAEGTYTKK